jgi:hypothetical protein
MAQPIEQVLPRDMINLILDQLSDSDLFNYALTSKNSLESAEKIWEKRMNAIQLPDESDETSSRIIVVDSNSKLPYYKKYVKKLGDLNIINIKKLAEDLRKKDAAIPLLEYIKSNLFVIYLKRMTNFRNSLKKKLKDFLYSHESEFDVAVKYYPIFFPAEFEIVYKEYLEYPIKNIDSIYRFDL